MKKTVFMLLIFLITLILIRCEYNNYIPDEKPQITFIKTSPGGCNFQGEDDIKRALMENDTLIFEVEKDTLDVFVGLNYICCAPFTSETRVSNDSIFISVMDTCSAPYASCYCKCVCYYTWDFQFLVSGEKKYWFEILLIDPRENQPIVIKRNWIDLSD